MISGNELQMRLSQVQKSVEFAAGRCSQTGSVPMDIKDSLEQLDQRTNEIEKVKQHMEDEQQVRQCIDELEELSDRAKDACEQYGNVDPALRDAIMQAHRDLSDLKRQLH